MSQCKSMMLFVPLVVTMFTMAMSPVACHPTVEPDHEDDTGLGLNVATQELRSSQNPSVGTPTTSVKKVRLSDKGYRPTGLAGDLSVGIGQDWQVHLINVRTGEGHRLTGGVDRKWEAVISDSHVAWRSQSRLREVLSKAPLVRRSYHIFVMDIESSATRRITSGTAMRRNLQIDGSRLVWEESRTKVGDRYTEHDVYAYDVDLDEILPVADGPGSQRFPSIHGDRVVWIDDRDCAETKSESKSTRSCPGDLLDVYLYDFATGKERPVAKSTASGYHAPGIHGDSITWRGHMGRYFENSTVHLHSLADGRTRIIASYDNAHIGTPRVSADYVAWTVRVACDTSGTPPADMGTGAFLFGIESEVIQQLTGYPEPDVLLDRKTAVVHEGCWFPGPVYSVILD